MRLRDRIEDRAARKQHWSSKALLQALSCEASTSKLSYR
jgi:hypothetical protein